VKKVLVAYFSRTGKTKAMAEYIAEGVRIAGYEAEAKSISEIQDQKALKDYNGYIFGCPTYHRDITENMKTFLFLAEKEDLKGKAGGAFGSYTHSGDSAGIIFDTMEFVYKMSMVNLGPFMLKEHLVDTDEGLRACQQYGKAIGVKLSE
jgi:flavodoxin